MRTDVEVGWGGGVLWERLPGQLQAEQLLLQYFGSSSDFSFVPPFFSVPLHYPFLCLHIAA